MKGEKKWIGSRNWKSRYLGGGLTSGIAGSRNSSVTRNLTLSLDLTALSFHQVPLWVAEILPGTVSPLSPLAATWKKTFSYSRVSTKAQYWISLIFHVSWLNQSPALGDGLLWLARLENVGWGHPEFGLATLIWAIESPNHDQLGSRPLRWDGHRATEGSV